MSVRAVLGLAVIAAGGYWLFLQMSGGGPRRTPTRITGTSNSTSTNSNNNRTVFTPPRDPLIINSQQDSWWQTFVNGITPVAFNSGGGSGGTMSYEQAYNARGRSYEPVIRAAATRHGVPVNILMRQAWAESTFNPQALNGRTGAAGMFQFIPSTAAEYNVDVYDVNSSADGAARYMKRLYGRFGSWSLALAAYNWGQGNLNNFITTGRWGRAGNTAIPVETVQYVEKIMGTDVVAEITSEQRERGVYV